MSVIDWIVDYSWLVMTVVVVACGVVAIIAAVRRYDP